MKDRFSSWENAVAWIREQPDQVELVRACFYDDPLNRAAERYYNSSEWCAVRAILPRWRGKALDLGAGRGISSYALARDGWEVVALEPDTSHLVGTGAIRLLAEETGLDIQVEENWGESLPFPDDSFDVVHARQVLHHANDLKRLCCEVARVLKKGGTFIATREHVISRNEDLGAFLAVHPLHKIYGGENAFLLQDYLDAIRESGISITKVLNPYQSDINLYPETITQFKRRIAARVGLPSNFVLDIFLEMIGLVSNTPGRIYTFVGRKN